MANESGKAANEGGNAGNAVSQRRWLSVNEAATALGIAPRSVRYRAKEGLLECRRDGRRVLYRVDLEAGWRIWFALRDHSQSLIA
jgi:DNA-binding transcriptional ArsR family regulator